ncbi:hypothetical protein HY478_00215 [Candidatus Uhrbacteria bacterium]|nr:hypothetical protein [Candidatus Uhrbacteria bacterium]
MNWTKDAALAELNSLTTQAQELISVRRHSEDHVRWVAKTKRFFKEVFGEDSDYYVTFTALTWSRRGAFVVGGPARPEESWNPQLGVDRVNQEAYERDLGIARGLLLAAQDELQQKQILEVYRGKDTGPEASLIVKIIGLAEYKLRKTIRKSPLAEQEIQDAFENLLIGADIPYSRETDRIAYSSKTYTPDFSVEKADLAIEIKLSGKKEREKQIIAEINDDILAYKTKFGNGLFIVYDNGFIRDVERFIGNFEDQEGIIVKIVKH